MPKKEGFSNRSSVGEAMTEKRFFAFYARAKALYLAFRKEMHLGIIKITYKRTATHCMNDRFVNLGERR